MASKPGLTERDRDKIQAYLDSGNVEDLIDGTTRHAETLEQVSNQTCARARVLAREGRSSAEVGREVGRHASTIRKHLRGDCCCAVAEPPLTYDDEAERWRVVSDPSRDYELDDYPACPHCQHNRTGLFTTRASPDRDWYCEKCGAGFDDANGGESA